MIDDQESRIEDGRSNGAFGMERANFLGGSVAACSSIVVGCSVRNAPPVPLKLYDVDQVVDSCCI